MEEFTYTATKDGKTITGTVSGNSKEAVINSLKKQSLHPIIVKKKKSKNGFNIKLGQKVGLKDLAVFTRQLSTMVSAGVPLSRALATLQAQASNKYFKDVIGDIGKNVEGGLPLSDGFAKYPNIFSEVYVSMVRAGEAGGILEDILKRLASQIERDSSMRKKIKSAMTYPVVILVVTVISFFGIMILIIPKISKILTDLGGEDAELPIYTRGLS